MLNNSMLQKTRQSGQYYRQVEEKKPQKKKYCKTIALISQQLEGRQTTSRRNVLVWTSKVLTEEGFQRAGGEMCFYKPQEKKERAGESRHLTYCTLFLVRVSFY